MRALTEREKRTVRYGAIAVAVYLTLFGGYHVWRFLEGKRIAYQKLVAEAQERKQQIQPYEDKVLIVKKLMDTFHLDPAKLSRATLVADASAAIQRAAMSGGIRVGPVRESPARASARELASVQLEGTGRVPAVMGFLSQIQGLGFPLIIDSVQLTPETTRPGQVKVNLTIVILDFDQWKTKEAHHA